MNDKSSFVVINRHPLSSNSSKTSWWWGELKICLMMRNKIDFWWLKVPIFFKNDFFLQINQLQLPYQKSLTQLTTIALSKLSLSTANQPWHTNNIRMSCWGDSIRRSESLIDYFPWNHYFLHNLFSLSSRSIIVNSYIIRYHNVEEWCQKPLC